VNARIRIESRSVLGAERAVSHREAKIIVDFKVRCGVEVVCGCGV
jgi:hypothetical protein